MQAEDLRHINGLLLTPGLIGPNSLGFRFRGAASPVLGFAARLTRAIAERCLRFKRRLQPGPAKAPFSFHRARRYPHGFGGFFHRQAAEKTQLDNLQSTGVFLSEPAQRFVERQQVIGALWSKGIGLVDLNHLRPSPALLRQPGTRVVNQNAPHQLSGNGEKVRPILPRNVLLIRKFEVGFVNQSGRLQGMARTLPPHEGRSQTPQFVVNQRNQLRFRPPIALLEAIQKARYIAGDFVATFSLIP